MSDSKDLIISDIIDVLIKILGNENKKLMLLTSFGVIIGELPDRPEETVDTADKSAYAFILLSNAEIRPFKGDKYTMPLLTVLLDQIVGVSLLSSLD